MKHALLSLFTSFLLTAPIFSQYQTEHRFTINSNHLDDTREVWVSLPKYYHQNKYKCHTLYLFDGDNIQSNETIKAIRNELFECGGYIEPLIIVGVEQKVRNRELSPYGSRGKVFQEFIESELIPCIESSYSTNGDRIIAGHSLGGYYALHLWMKSNLFSSCFAFSPAIYNNENRITKDIVEYLEANQPKGHVYVNNGTQGNTERRIKEYIEELKSAFTTHGNQDLYFKYDEHEGQGHNFTPMLGLADALLFHFSRWQFDDKLIDKLWSKEIDPIIAYESVYEGVDDWAGYKVKRENDLLNNISSHYLRTGDTIKAVEIINYAILNDSLDGFTHLKKGEILMSTDKKEAKHSFANALIHLKPEDVFENTKNFREFDFWKDIIAEHLKTIEN